MSSDNIPATKNSSLFLSLFSRKKRPNRSIAKSLDDNKKINSSSSIPFLSNGKTITNNNNHSHNSNSHLNITTHKNGYNNLGNTNSLTVPFESASTSWAKEFQLSQQQYHHHQQKQQQQEQHQQQQQQYHQQQQQYHQQQQQYQQQQQQHVDLTFMDHVRYNNSYRNHNKNINVDDLSSLPLRTTDTVSNIRSRSESRTVTEKSPVLLLPKKAYSVDAMNQTNSVYLMEALETLGDVQPRVARSIPKHANVDTSNFAARSLENCLFDATVYDAMLHDSLKVCEMLQNHLSQCIVTARTNCPDGYLDVLTEESEEDAETTYSGQVHQTHHTNSTQNSATLITDPLKSLISEKATFE